MRAPQRRRPRLRQIVEPPDRAGLDGLAARARYVGSPEHKDVPSFAGPPRLRADASCCPRGLADGQDMITEWLRDAIRRGATGAPWEGAFPRYVWYKSDEWPDGIAEIYADHVRD